jgi:hypothetical protein
LLIVVGGESSGQRLELRGAVEVQRNTVLLSDLLPAEASPWVREASARVDLGPAPALGTTRIIDSTRIAAALSMQPGLLPKVAIPERVLVRRAGFPVSRESVLNALQRFYPASEKNPDLKDAELHWDAGWARLTRDSKLEVRRAWWDAARKSWQWWMHAEDGAQSPDFLVQSTGPKLSLARGQAATAASAPPESNAEPLLVHEGARAWLTVEGGGIRLRTEVICLESGGLGQRIRVRSLTGQRVFQAEIMGDKLLEARFAL